MHFPATQLVTPGLERRSSSLDADSDCSTSCPADVPQPPPRAGSATGGGLLSRLSKTLEDKIHEIKQEKLLKERERAVCDDFNSGYTTDTTDDSNSIVEKSPENKLLSDISKSFDLETIVHKPNSISLSNSPSRKSSFAQDFSELRSELGRSIPKLSELRNRKVITKDSRSRSNFSLNSILGRDDGVLLDDLLPEEGDEVIEAGVEAEEGILYTGPEAFTNSPNCEAPDVPQDLHFINMSSLPSSTNEASQQVLLDNESYQLKEKTVQNILIEKLISFNKTYGFICKTVAVIIFVCFALPIPSFVSGFILGGFLVGLLSLFLLKVLVPTEASFRHSHRAQRPILLNLPTVDDHQHYKVMLGLSLQDLGDYFTIFKQ